MNDRFNALDSGEVISIQKDGQVLVGHRIFRVSELNEAIADRLKNAVDGWTEEKSDWFNARGIDCEALRFGSNAWQKGKIRLCLEFCPDEVTTSVPGNTNVTPAVVTAAPAAAPVPAPAPPANPNLTVADRHPPTATVTNPPQPTELKTVPIAGIAAVAAVGAGAAVMAASAAAVNSASIPNVATVTAPATIATPALADLILEPEDKPVANTPTREGLEEIAFDFDVSNDNLGTMVPNGMMELDLTDLDLDRAENDYLDFETGGIPDPSLELNSLHSTGKAENSGMLIDEVWNEMSQPNWPGIH